MSNKFENYKPAPLSCLLPCHDKEEHNIGELELREKAHKLEKALMSFGISAEVVDIKCGPSVTRFEVSLKPGTKISKVTGLEDDIMMALAAYSIRIEAPVPGKYSIAVEIPNEHNETVRLRKLVETDDYLNSSPLNVPVGLDVSDSPVYCDLAKMPHLLVAGSTGSGKSSCINAFLAGILLHSSPEDVRLILIDPKIVEYYAYNGIPHLLMPVINDPNQAIGALKWAICEMLRRYKLFEESAVRDIKEFNEKHKDDPEFERMPRILLVIDELAELMRVSAGKVEICISRLAIYSRAAGIHMLIATQRPSPDVITGVIKSNILSRIAFAVSSRIDSRTILDHCGAERLLGKGDMLYSPAYAPRPFRCQGVFTTGTEIDSIVDFLKNQYGPCYDMSVVDVVDRLAVGNYQDTDNNREESEKNRIKGILKEAAEFYYESFYDEEIGALARDFLDRRGISQRAKTDFKLGCSPLKKTALYDFLKKKGYNDEELLESGIFAMSHKTKTLYDLFSGRLVFPVFDEFGTIIAFGGRALGDEWPKYINSPDSIVYNKANCLYALNIAKKTMNNQIIIVEGYMDVLSMHSSGLNNAVSILGPALSDSQIRLCTQYGKEVIFFFDSDKNGQDAVLRAVEKMMAHLKTQNAFNNRLRIAVVPDGMGLKEYIDENGPEKVKEVIKYAYDVEDYLLMRAEVDNTDAITGVLDQWKYKEDICLYASWMNDEINISKMAGVAAPLLGATPESVASQIRKYIKYNG